MHSNHCFVEHFVQFWNFVRHLEKVVFMILPCNGEKLVIRQNVDSLASFICHQRRAVYIAPLFHRTHYQQRSVMCPAVYPKLVPGKHNFPIKQMIHFVYLPVGFGELFHGKLNKGVTSVCVECCRAKKPNILIRNIIPQVAWYSLHHYDIRVKVIASE